MTVLRKKTRMQSQEVLDPSTCQHGTVGWVNGREYIYDRPKGRFLPRAEFLEVKKNRAAENRMKYTTKRKRQDVRDLRFSPAPASA